MGKSATITIRVDQELKDRLESQAEVQKRSKSFLANEAIQDYLDVQEWQIAGIEKAIRSLNAGHGIPHEDVMNWVQSWGSDKELPKPTA
jgi:RHH-type rel operon transcriptional repressor/antitoxin RelB